MKFSGADVGSCLLACSFQVCHAVRFLAVVLLHGRHVLVRDACRAFAKLNFHPERPWMDSYLLRCQQVMSSTNSQELSTILYSLSLLDVKPPAGWTQAFIDESGFQLTSFGSQSLANTIYGLARVGQVSRVGSAEAVSFHTCWQPVFKCHGSYQYQPYMHHVC